MFDLYVFLSCVVFVIQLNVNRKYENNNTGIDNNILIIENHFTNSVNFFQKISGKFSEKNIILFSETISDFLRKNFGKNSGKNQNIFQIF